MSTEAVSAYLGRLTPGQMSAFMRLREIVQELAPDAQLAPSYGILAFNYKGKHLLFFGAFKNHMSLYPASDAMVEALGDKIAKRRTSKGTLKFTEDKPLSDDLLKAIVRFQLSMIDDSSRKDT